MKLNEIQECDLEDAWNQRRNPDCELSEIAARCLNWHDFLCTVKRELAEDDY